MTDDPKITKLPIRFKAQPADERMLKVISSGACDHKWRWANGQMMTVTYQIREGETEVECGVCGTRLDPMFVLMRLACEETRIEQNRAVYAEEMARLKERTRTKCQHCKQMTRISHR